jgi:hypothetical protein
MELAKEGIKQGVKEGFKQQGGKMSIKKLLKGAAPVAKDFGMILAKEGIKEGVKQGFKQQGGRVTKEFFEAEKQIFPKGKKALQEFLKGAGYGSESSSDEEYEGGVLLRDVPSQFHSSVYPPALQSYTAGKDAYGRGRAKGGARPKSARGAIVSEIMKKHGLSLPEASKYVKQHNLY